MSERGYFAVGIEGGKTPSNLGTLWRTAWLYGAAFIFTIGKRYPERGQATDTPKVQRHTPLFHFETVEDFADHVPHGCDVVGVELMDTSRVLGRYVHPERAVYVLGAEDHGLSSEVLNRCRSVLRIPSVRSESMNVAVAGSIVAFDRHMQRPTPSGSIGDDPQ